MQEKEKRCDRKAVKCQSPKGEDEDTEKEVEKKKTATDLTAFDPYFDFFRTERIIHQTEIKNPFFFLLHFFS